MFLGVVPADCIKQIFKVMDFSGVRDVHLCCSGTFRLERAFAQLHPEIRVHSNDVSLFSCVIGGLATEAPVDFRFVGELEWVEGELSANPIERAAAVMVAFEMARYASRSNIFTQRHFDYYAKHFLAHTSQMVPKVEALLAALNVSTFFGGDWLEHAKAGIEKDATTLAFPPFTKGGYEIQFKFLNENVQWDEPAYGLWDPKDLQAETRKLEAAGSKYCILTDQLWDDQEPVLKFSAGLRLPHYCYAHTSASSLVSKQGRSAPFRYKRVEVDNLRADTKITIVPADGATMNFIKDVYLAKGIKHVTWSQNFLIFADDALVGSVIYDEGPKTRLAYGNHTLLLLSDLAVNQDGKLSKLVASIATSRSLIRTMETKLLKRYDRLVTTAFSKHPNSMKYRGVFKKHSRRRNDDDTGFVIQYMAPVSELTPQQIYETWWKKYGPSK